MIRKILLFLIILTVATIVSFSQKSAPADLIVGCYSDLREISEGVIGNSVIRITRENGKYAGTFAELSNELGMAYDEVPLENLIIDRLKGTIAFDIKSRQIAAREFKTHKREITGRITKAGIKMNWRDHKGEYGTVNSFMKRKKSC